MNRVHNATGVLYIGCQDGCIRLVMPLHIYDTSPHQVGVEAWAESSEAAQKEAIEGAIYKDPEALAEWKVSASPTNIVMHLRSSCTAWPHVCS